MRSFAAHPGYASTELQSHTETLLDKVMEVGNRFLAQDAVGGARPTLYAATMPDLPSGAYYGPDGLGRDARATPSRSRPRGPRTTPGWRPKLWDQASELTGVTFSF